jgi:hypothetical protein
MDFHPLNLQMAMIVPGTVGAGAANGINISLKNAHRAFIYCFNAKKTDATRCTWTLQQSSGNAGSASGTGEKAMTAAVPVYYSDGFGTSNALTSTTAAVAYQQAATQDVQQVVVFEVVPEACMDLPGGFDCIVVNASDPGAANTIMAFAIIEPRNVPLPTPYSD